MVVQTGQAHCDGPTDGSDASMVTQGNNILNSIAHLKSLLTTSNESSPPPSSSLPSSSNNKISTAQSDEQQQHKGSESRQQQKSIGPTTALAVHDDNRKKIEQLESAQREWKERFELEKQRRESLDKTYQALLGHRKELSVQLDLLTKSREKVEQELSRKIQQQQEERDNVASHKIFQERYEESYRLRAKFDTLQTECNKLQEELKLVQRSRDESNQQISTLKDDIGRLETQLQSKTTELVDVRKEHQSELQKIQQQLITTQHAKDDAINKVTQLEQQLNEQQHDMEQTIQQRIDVAISEYKLQMNKEEMVESSKHSLLEHQVRVVGGGGDWIVYVCVFVLF